MVAHLIEFATHHYLLVGIFAVLLVLLILSEMSRGGRSLSTRELTTLVNSDQALVIGTCGFTHGPEADGTVEIAYFTFPEYEGRGYAKAMASELLTRALQSSNVRDVIAHTLPEHNASTRILESVGLQHVGDADDADVGKVWRWAYRARD